MKKKILFFIALFAFMINGYSQQSIVKDAFVQLVEHKISSIQKVIPITEEQAAKLKETELNFLLEVNSAENCFWCNTKKRVEKLKAIKEEQLKEILSLDQFIKYDALENRKIQKHPIWMSKDN